MISKRAIYLIIPFLIVVLSYYIFGFSNNQHNKVKKIKTIHDESHGFFLTHKGHFLTNYAVMVRNDKQNQDNIFHDIVVAGDIVQSEYVTRKAYLEKNKALQGYSLLKVNDDISEDIYELGDSDSVEVGDQVILPGSVKGQILFKLNNFNEYNFPCLIADLPHKKDDLGKPVLDINNRVIGLYISYKKNYLIIPINRIKPLIKDFLNSVESVSLPGESPEATSDEKIAEKPLGELKPIAQFGGNPDYHFGSIKDIAFDHKNNLYLIDDQYNEIKRISLSGLVKELSAPKKLEIAPPKDDVKDNDKEKMNKTKNEETKVSNLKDKSAKLEESKDKNMAQKEIPKSKMPESSLQTIKVSLKKPVSLSITLAGLIYVLDDGDQAIVIFNEDLKKVDRIQYQDITDDFHPVKIRTFNNEIYVISDTERHYHLIFDKQTNKTKAVLLDNLTGNSIIDLAYEKSEFYGLDKKYRPRQVQLVESMQDNMEVFFIIKGDFPSSLSVYQDEVYVFDQETKKIAVYGRDGNFLRYWSGMISTKQGNPHLMQVSPAGILAVAYHDLPFIRLFHLNGKLIKELSPFSKGEIESPLSIAFDNLKRLFIITGSSEIHIFPTGKDDRKESSQLSEIKYLFKKDFSFSFRGITTGSKGDIFISDTKKDRLLTFPRKPDSKKIVYSGKQLGELNQPIQLASFQGNIYIADKENHRVVVVNEKGVLQKSFLIRDKDNHLLSPQDITVTPKKEIVVLAENKVVKYNFNGERLSEFGIKKGDNSYIGYAKGIAYDKGTIYVTDTYNHMILRYDEKGKLLGQFGKKGGNLDEFFYPWDIITHDHQLYVVDKGNHRIVQYGYQSEPTKTKIKNPKSDQ